MHLSHSRPLGPRSIVRPNSPSPPPPLSLETTPPLVIRKAPKDSLSPPALAPLVSRSPTPSLSLLSIPGSAKPRPATPKGVIRLSIPSVNGTGNGAANQGAETPLFESYYGGPSGPPLKLNTDSPDDMTIRPPIRVTTIPQKSSDPLEDLHRTMSDLELSATSPPPVRPQTEEVTTPFSPSQWSDDVLEEISRLGEGAGGAVHKVRDKRNDTIMARKTITTREAPMKQLLRELAIISSTKHVNIILFYGAYMSPSSSEVKILMEFGEGGSLEAVGKRIKEIGAVVGEKIAGRLAEGVLQGLAYLHTQKTIHRDIKPSNILLSREGIVKLCDFGVSGELIESMAGTFTGTSFYMAPERICGDQYTIRSDVWSTGISLLELVQNRFPFPNDLPPIDLMMYITQSEPPRLDDEPGVQWSDAMKDFVKETLTVDALTRPTPKDMLAHPWIVGVMRQEVHMARWIREVWGWPKSSQSKYSRKSVDNGVVRQSTSRSGSRPPSLRQTSASSTSPEPKSRSSPEIDT